MTEKEKQISRLISSRLKENAPEAEIVLFGSHAREEAHAESDWDILILLKKPKKNRKIEDKYRDVLFNIEMEIGEPISVFVLSQDEWETKHLYTPLYSNIKKDGIII